MLRRIASIVFSLWIYSLCAAACELATAVKDATIDDIKSFFENQNKDFVAHIYDISISPSSITLSSFKLYNLLVEGAK